MLMLSATQIYTILTVQLFAFLNLLPVEADILAVSVRSVYVKKELSHIIVKGVEKSIWWKIISPMTILKFFQLASNQ